MAFYSVKGVLAYKILSYMDCFISEFASSSKLIAWGDVRGLICQYYEGSLSISFMRVLLIYLSKGLL